MSKKSLRSLGLSMTLILGAATLHAQRGSGGEEPPRDPPGCTCVGAGVRCVFGNAGGCQIWCIDNTCRCSGAWCFLGFPRASSCRCTGVRP